MDHSNKKRKRRAVTLIEMIVVMLLIATITGALAYNYNSSLTEGKAFRTKEGISRIKTILAIALVENDDVAPEELVHNWQAYVRNSPMAGKEGDLEKDGWGKPYVVSMSPNQEIEVISESYEAYKNKKSRR
jgi:general secretion pathway protein G